MLRSLCSAFLMYSRIPVPQVEWNEENRRYALGWFPAVGAVLGLLLVLWQAVCSFLDAGAWVYAAGGVLLPVVLTGGIHLDGFCDVTDARASCASREKKLQIMTDPHIGSFAVIYICLYLIVQTVLFAQVYDLRCAVRTACGFILSRSISGFFAVTLRGAKSGGTLQSFVKPSHRNCTIYMVCGWAVLGCAGMLCTGLSGGTACIAAAVLAGLFCKRTAEREFGGITGDICGWFLQICEIWMLGAGVAADLLARRFAW